MNKPVLKELLLKYHCAGGRYTTFPQKKEWKNNLTHHDWLEDFEKSFSHNEGIDLYIHIPFCKSLCTFCGCNITVTKNYEIQREYIDALLQEWKIYTDTFHDVKVSTIYLGGGTPNFLTPDNLERLLNGINNYQSDLTGTIEVDPRHLSKEQLKVLKNYNFKRISFGIQDFNEEILHNLNRPQTLEQVKNADMLSREYGFDEVSYDLIYGLPLQNPKTIVQTFEEIRILKPEAIAFYPLAVVPWQAQSQSALSIWQTHSITEKYELYLTGNEILEDLGYINLGFGHYIGTRGQTSLALKEDNLQRTIMGFTPKKSKQLIGLGVSAISYSGSSFLQNEKILPKYARNISNKSDVISGHKQSHLEIKLMNFYHSLVCKGSVNLNTIRSIYNSNNFDHIISALQYMQNDKLVLIQNDKLIITNIGKHFIKNICQVFDSPPS